MEPTDELTAEERRRLIASMRPADAEGVPELHEVDIPDELREQIEAAMARYPQLRSASIPALWAVQRHYGWCSPGGHPPGGRGDGRHARPTCSRSRSSTTSSRPRRSARHQVLVCHNISCWMNGADEPARGVLRGDRRRSPRGRPRTARPRRTASSSSRASSASAPATSRRWPRSTSATTGRSPTRTRSPRSRRFARATSRCPTRRSPSAPPRAAPSGPTRRRASPGRQRRRARGDGR